MNAQPSSASSSPSASRPASSPSPPPRPAPGSDEPQRARRCARADRTTTPIACARPCQDAGPATASDSPLVIPHTVDLRARCAMPRPRSDTCEPHEPAPSSSPPTTSSLPANRRSDNRRRRHRPPERDRRSRATARARPPAHRRTSKLGDLVRFQGHFDEAEEILRRALAECPAGTTVTGVPVRGPRAQCARHRLQGHRPLQRRTKPPTRKHSS